MANMAMIHGMKKAQEIKAQQEEISATEKDLRPSVHAASGTSTAENNKGDEN